MSWSGAHADFVQDNESMSKRACFADCISKYRTARPRQAGACGAGSRTGCLCGHPPDSPTYGQHYKVVWTMCEGRCSGSLPGFAHGFVALEEGTVFAYKCTAYYHPCRRTYLLDGTMPIWVSTGGSQTLHQRQGQGCRRNRNLPGQVRTRTLTMYSPVPSSSSSTPACSSHRWCSALLINSVFMRFAAPWACVRRSDHWSFVGAAPPNPPSVASASTSCSWPPFTLSWSDLPGLSVQSP
jgi:hypothetical protein